MMLSSTAAHNESTTAKEPGMLRVVIVRGGFGGLATAKTLGKAPGNHNKMM
jgi:hypothetical protein